MTRARAAATCACLLLGACDQGPFSGALSQSLSKDQAQAMLTIYEHQICNQHSFYSGPVAGVYPPPTGDQMGFWNWARTTLGNAQVYHPRGQQGDARFFVYSTDGYDYKVALDDETAPQGADGNPHLIQHMVVSACMQTPDQLNVEDITTDAANPKLATVTYTVSTKLSPFGQIMQGELGTVANDGVVDRSTWASVFTVQSNEYRATFRRLDETGWRIDSARQSITDTADLWAMPSNSGSN